MPNLEPLKWIALKLFTFVLPICLSGQISVMSFNIRYDNPADGPNAWSERKVELSVFLDSTAPDIIGLQEALHSQVVFLDSALSDYAFVGVGRDDGKTEGEYAPIFYRQSWFKLLSFETYWLSESGDTGSVGWDAALPRILEVAKFQYLETGKVVMVLNTHFDHQGKEALEGSTLLTFGTIQQYRRMQPYADAIVLLGDFNAEPETAQMRFLASQMDDTFQKSQNGPFGPEGTFNSFDVNRVSKRRIDYIYTDDFQILDYQCINKSLSSGGPISDHWPIMVRLDFE